MVQLRDIRCLKHNNEVLHIYLNEVAKLGFWRCRASGCLVLNELDDVGAVLGMP